MMYLPRTKPQSCKKLGNIILYLKQTVSKLNSQQKITFRVGYWSVLFLYADKSPISNRYM